MGRDSHSHYYDKAARYRGEWSAVDYIHEYDIDLEKREIYLVGRDDYMAATADANTGASVVNEPGVDFSMANRFMRNIRILMSVTTDPILIHLKTCGGFWEEGMAIYDAIKACPNTVTILNYAAARSMSSLIFLAADHRVMMPHATFMLHDGTSQFDGTVRQAQTEMEQLTRTMREMREIYVDKLVSSERFGDKSRGQIESWLQRKMRDKEDVWFTAQEALEHNFADEIFGVTIPYDWVELRMK